MRKALRITGYIVLFTGLLGLFAPRAFGGHVGLWHNALHIGVGLIALRYARMGTDSEARLCAVVIGASYIALGGLGFVFGSPGSPLRTPGLSDFRLFRLIPGVVELTTADHYAHFGTGLLCFLTGIFARPEPVARVETRRRESALR